MENENIPIDIPRNATYTTVNTYVHDLLYLHDSHLRHQANGASDAGDCLSQISVLSTMRTVYPEFFDRKPQRGPFVLTLTDMHLSNIFVDRNWQVTKLLDLEWACAQPIEMQHPPYWLTTRWVDKIDEDQYSKFSNEYISAIAEEEEKATEQRFLGKETNELPYSERLKKLWEHGTFRYTLALNSPSRLHNIFFSRILPMYQTTEDKDRFEDAFFIATSTFWCTRAWDFIRCKGEDKEQYDKDLEDAFQQ